MAENPCSPDVAIAGGVIAALVSGLSGFEIFADSVESQAIRRIHHCRCILTPVVAVLLIFCSLNDGKVKIEVLTRPWQRSEFKGGVMLDGAA